jgi:hypothetical protein
LEWVGFQGREIEAAVVVGVLGALECDKDEGIGRYE